MNEFEDLMIVGEDGTPEKLNVIGIMKVGGDTVIALTDSRVLDIAEGEYELFHLLQDDNFGRVSIKDIENDDLYAMLVDAWESREVEGT